MKFVHQNLGCFTILETVSTSKPLSKIALLPVLCALLAPPHSACADTNQVGVITGTYSAVASGSSDVEQYLGEYQWVIAQDQISISVSGTVQYAVVQNGTNYVLGSQLSEGPDNSVTVSGTGTDDVADGDVCYASWTYYQEGGGLDIDTYTTSGDGWAYCFVNVGLDMSGSTACGGFNTLGWSDAGGLMEEPVLEFAVANPSLPWTESLSRSLTNPESWSGWSGGANGSATVAITLSYAPSRITDTFTAEPVSGFAPLTVNFDAWAFDSSHQGVSSYCWDFGDGSINSHSSFPAHTYTNAGDYAIGLVCTNALGQTVLGDGPANIHVEPLTIQFTASPTNGTMPLTVQFSCPGTDSSGSAVTEWNWDFGDGETSLAQNPTHVYTNADTFAVSLTVINGNDQTIVATGPATIAVESPSVQFTATPLIGVEPLMVLFNCPGTDNGGTTITTWEWEFNDGGSNTTRNPSYTYYTPGIYSPSLSAINSLGDEINGFGPSVTVASRSGLVINGDFETGNFYAWTNNDSSMYYSSVSSGSYYAQSGDYGAELSASYGSSGQLSQPLATTPGSSYLVSFWLNNLTTMPGNPFSVSWGGTTIWNGTNIAATGWTNVQLIVAATSTNTSLQFGFSGITPFGLDDVDVESRYIQFTATPLAGAAPLPVQFTSPAVDNNGRAITAWNWNFGDGSTGAGRTPSHSYTSGGQFIVALTATNSNGNTIVGFGPTITVSVPTLQFTANPTAGGVPLTVQFNSPNQDSGGNAIAARLWIFGDGSTSTTQNPTHIYSQAGLFAPKLVATNTQSVVIVATGPTVTVAACEGLVVNGGFETGDFTGWTTSGNFEECYIVSNTPSFTHAGTWGAYLEPSGALGYLSQTITTTPGAGYRLSLWLNNNYGSTPNEFLVSWNGSVLFDHTNMSAFGWTNLLFNVTASGTTASLQLGFDNDGVFGVDNVSLMPVVKPPPAFCGVSCSGRNLEISGTNAAAGVIYCLLTSTNLALPLTQWTPVATNIFSAGGNFAIIVTNAVTGGIPQRFYVFQAAAACLSGITLSGLNLEFSGINGQSGGTYYLLMSTNVAKPLSQWTPIAATGLTADGNFTITATNAMKANVPQCFYILESQ